MLTTRTIRKLLGDLADPDETKRRSAATALAEADERAIYPLIQALRDVNPGVQDAAIRSLIELGGEITAYMVLPLLREDALVRNSALLVLKALGRVSVPLLYPLLKDRDDDVRKFAVDLLADIRDDVLPERVAPCLADQNPNVRAAAVRAIGELGYGAAIPALVERLRDEEWVCFVVLETLGELRAEVAVPEIVRLLGSESLALRLAAIETLGRIGSATSADALRAHVARAGDRDEKVSAVKSLVLVGVSPSMSELSGILREMWREGEDWDDRIIALRGLVAARETSAIYDIADVGGSLDISNPEDEERYQRVRELLREFGCDAELTKALACGKLRFRGRMLVAAVLGDLRCPEALGVLASLVDVDNRDVRRAVIEAIGAIDADEAVDILLGHVGDHDSHVRRTAVAALARQRVSRSFDPLMERLDVEPYQDVTEEIVRALLRVAPERIEERLDAFPVGVREDIGRFSEHVETLLKLSRDEDARVRLSGLYGLGRLGGERAEARLVEVLGDVNPEVRRTAVIALGPALVDFPAVDMVLRDEDMWVRLHGVRALGESGSEGALDRIGRMLKDEETPVLMAAVEALAGIGGARAKDLLGALSGHRDEGVREAALHARERL